MKNRSFLGIGWHFQPEFNKEAGGTVMVSNEENIRQSLWILLSTSPAERIHRYGYGCSIRKYVFEQMDVTTQTLLKEQIQKAIIMYEPRIIPDSILFDMEKQAGVLLIELNYTIRQTNRRSNMVYPFYLNEGTDLTW